MQMPKKYKGKLLTDEEITDVINEILGKKAKGKKAVYPVPEGGLLLLVCEEERIAEVVDYDEENLVLTAYENEVRRALNYFYRPALIKKIKALFYRVEYKKTETVQTKPIFDASTLKKVEDLVSYARTETENLELTLKKIS